MATKNFYGGSGGGDLLNASSGHDALSGGQGNDTMTDAITDFSVVDILDFSAINLADGANDVSFTEQSSGTMVSALLGGVMHDVVMLEDRSAMDVSDMFDDGPLLV